MNKLYLLFATSFIAAYYFIERHPKIELETIIRCSKDFDYTSFQGINIASDEEQLEWWLYGFFLKPSSPNLPVDSTVVQGVVDSFNFENYDCLISYHHELVDVYWSPFLTQYLDDCNSWLGKIPLFAHLDTTITSQIYLYRIEDKYKFRSRCP